MKCCDCLHYTSGYMYNFCDVLQLEYIMTTNDCKLVHEDGSLNYNNEFIKEEYGEGNDEP